MAEHWKVLKLKQNVLKSIPSVAAPVVPVPCQVLRLHLDFTWTVFGQHLDCTWTAMLLVMSTLLKVSTFQKISELTQTLCKSVTHLLKFLKKHNRRH